MAPTLHTARLLLTPVGAQDLHALTRLGATPAPHLQVGPATYPCYRLHPQPPRYAPSEPL